MTEKTLSKVDRFRQELNRVFDDNLHTKQWHNYVDYAIIGLIVISTIEVFFSLSVFFSLTLLALTN